ncbi:hypothetical protein BN903_72 [Halorubrum sp. AJ67]|nr:hypothetical protein BN903_72 [Halorubrum sp. AJ67]
MVPRLHGGDDPAVEDGVEFVALEGDVVGSVQSGVCPDQQCHIRVSAGRIIKFYQSVKR